MALPQNRWDLLDDRTPAEPPRVTVIVAHYKQYAELDRTLFALSRQSQPADRLEIIVVDDGSPTAPTVPAGVRLLRQTDEGFRLAAARNLGAAAATGDLLCFLDADTTPEPDYIAELCRLPALASDVVTVGRRRHADLAGLPVDAPVETAAVSHLLPDPEWLTDAYRASRNLLDADDRSYRYMIGAVICCSRRLFDTVGGFAETFTDYGGEDWEWAHRAWQHGALFAHVPTALAWHDGPHWAARPGTRDDARRLKNAETLRLAATVAVPESRPRALRMATADVVVRIRSAASLAALVICVDRLLLAVPECTVVLPAPADCAFDPASESLAATFGMDSRVALPARGDGAAAASSAAAAGAVAGAGAVAVAGARLLVDMDAPCLIAPAELRSALSRITLDDLAELTVRDPGGSRILTVVALRAARREARCNLQLFPRVSTTSPSARLIAEEPDLAAHFSGRGDPDAPA